MIKLTTDLRETAIAIAQEAGQAIMQVYAGGFDVRDQAMAKQLLSPRPTWPPTR